MENIIGTSKEELKALYMNLPKEKLAEMLANRDSLSLEQITVKCDSCGCTPSVIIRTNFGSFCQPHARYT